MSSKIKVATIPATTANPTRNQNSVFSFLSFSLFSSWLTGGSDGGGLSGWVDFMGSVSGISSFSSGVEVLVVSGPGVGADFFFLNLAM